MESTDILDLIDNKKESLLPDPGLSGRGLLLGLKALDKQPKE